MPDFFIQHAHSLLLPKARDGTPGLRRAQLGATHALGSHFTLSSDPALVSMPTGTGKTAVIMLAPFLLESKRSLVITPSRMVRDQIMEGFASLELLKTLGVLPVDLDTPNAVAVESRIQSSQDWIAFADADVVITTPMGSSPAIQQIPKPPEDLFDLLLVDEAHHSPAETWSALIDAFPRAKCVLFTATPFRRDRKRLRGRFVYEFPLREALKDGVFGQIEFVRCESQDSIPNDVVIAKRAEEVLLSDRAGGFDHRIMVRTDSRTRANELAKTYLEATSLKLVVIHGQHSLRHVRKTVQAVRSGELDGVICVDMFGEGFDLPQLKIAAIHSPHKSLSVTLQFIGRFARTSGANLGIAKFIAVPEEIQTETQILYEEGAVWRDLVPNLADTRVAAEREVREQLSTFSRPTLNTSVESDLDLGIITPWYHCKIFKVSGPVNLDQDIEVRANESLARRFHSIDLSCAVFVVCKTTKPRWLETPTLQDVEYSLCVVYFDEKRGLLFINSTEKTEDFYSQVAEHLTIGVFCGIPTARISRALRLLTTPSFYSVGLKNRMLGNDVESYRILSGSKVDGAVSNLDAQLFDRGHLFGGGESAEGKVTLGISTLSKVWSNRSGFVPEFVTWCRALADNLENSAPIVTGSRIDLLAVGEEVASFPAPPIGASWHESVYKHHPILVDKVHGASRRDLLSLELRCVTAECTATEAVVELLGFDAPIRVQFSLQAQRQYRIVSSPCDIAVLVGKNEGTLDEYLNSVGIHLYLADFSRLFGREWFRSNLTLSPLSKDCVQCRDWIKSGVDIGREFGTSMKGTSIHDFLDGELIGSLADVVIYDHRPGEVADFVVLYRQGTVIRCELIHCKGAGGDKPGSRVGDAYEVAGQIVKCVGWARSPSGLSGQMTRRLATGSKLRKGDLALLEELLSDAERMTFECRIILVQPGISFKGITDEVSHVLAGAYEYVVGTTGLPPSLWLSD